MKKINVMVFIKIYREFDSPYLIYKKDLHGLLKTKQICSNALEELIKSLKKRGYFMIPFYDNKVFLIASKAELLSNSKRITNELIEKYSC